MNEELREYLVAMKERDLKMRNSILNEGGLYDGYHCDMEVLHMHIKNAKELGKIIKENG